MNSFSPNTDPLPQDAQQLGQVLSAETAALIDGERDWIANLANVAAYLYQRLADLNWAGFYLWRNGELVLGPFQGKPACVRIAYGRGVCGTAVARRSSILVADVHAFPGHIACDSMTASELVVPLLDGDRLLGVIDLDSSRPDRFSEAERLALEDLASLLVSGSDWPADDQPQDLSSQNQEDATTATPIALRPGLIRNKQTYQQLYAESLSHPEDFWAQQIAPLRWQRWPERMCLGSGPDARWFPGGQLNMADNCLNRHIASGRGDATALIWESEAVKADGSPQSIRKWTYHELRNDVARISSVLQKMGVQTGDTVTITLPIVPELPIAMLACAWLGATHNVIFAGFPAQAIADRIRDSDSHVLITADAGWRNGKALPLKKLADEAAEIAGHIDHMLVLRHSGEDLSWDTQRDRWWHEELASANPLQDPVPVASEHPLFLMYTSGSTGKPKGIIHGTAGFLVHALLSSQHAFDLRPGDIHWCTADPAWITGHTYTVYGPLLSGASILLYEGILSFPNWDRAWEIVERHRPRTLYTTPTLIRSWMRHASPGLGGRDRSSLQILGSVGEPISPAVWQWFHDVAGEGRAPVVDTWWQTEVGAAALFTPPYAYPAKPGSAGLPFFGIAPAIADAEGRLLEGAASGQLVLSQSWPGQALGIRNDQARWLSTYWQKIPGSYLSGDSASRDADGYFRLLGRNDDVIKINGHRLGTAEVEAAIVSHPAVVEAAAIGIPDPDSGEAIVAYVVSRQGGSAVEGEIVQHIEGQVGKIARPRRIQFLDSLPKNRSGKILRRLLRSYAISGRIEGDLTTLDETTALPPPIQGKL